MLLKFEFRLEKPRVLDMKLLPGPSHGVLLLCGAGIGMGSMLGTNARLQSR